MGFKDYLLDFRNILKWWIIGLRIYRIDKYKDKGNFYISFLFCDINIKYEMKI